MHSDFSITPQRKNLDVAQRRMVLDELLEGSNNGMLRKKGDYTRVAEIFHTNRWTIAKLLEYYKQQKDAGKVSPDLHSKRKENGQAGYQPQLPSRDGADAFTQMPHHAARACFRAGDPEVDASRQPQETRLT